MEEKPRWEELCKQASVEQDSKKFMELIREDQSSFGTETEPIEGVRTINLSVKGQIEYVRFNVEE